MLLSKQSLALSAVVATTLLGFNLASVPGRMPNAAVNRPAQEVAGAGKAPAIKDLQGDALPPGALVRIASRRWQHAANINFADFLPDSKTVLTVSDDEIIHIWEYPSGKELRRFGPGTMAEPVPGTVRRCFGAALSSDGNTVAALFHSEITRWWAGIRLWDVATGKILPEQQNLKPNASLAVAFSPDGSNLATSDVDGTIRIFDWTQDKLTRSFGKPTGKEFDRGDRRALTFSPDGKSLLYVRGYDGNAPQPGYGWTIIEIWDPSTGQKKAGFFSNDSDSTPVFSPDSRLVALCGPKGGIDVADAGTGTIIRTFQDADGILAFSKDSGKVVTRDANSTIREWDIATGEKLRQFGELRARAQRKDPNDPEGMKLSPDGKALVVFEGDRSLGVVDLALGTVETSTRPFQYVGFIRNGRQLLTQELYQAFVQCWDTATGKAIVRPSMVGPKRYQDAKTVSPDGRYFLRYENGDIEDSGFLVPCLTAAPLQLGPLVAACLADRPPDYDRKAGSTILIDAATYRPVGIAPGGGFFSPDGKSLATFGWNGKLVLHDMPTMTRRCVLPLLKFDPTAADPDCGFVLCFSRDSRLLAAFKQFGEIAVWDTTAGKQMASIHLTGPAVFNGAFAPNGQALALEDVDGTVTVWELASGRQRRIFGPGPAKKSQKAKGTEKTHPEPRYSGPTVAFSPDGKLLAYAGLDMTIHIWDIATGKSVAKWRGHDGTLLWIAFTPDGHRLASGSDDGTVLIWDVAGLKK